MFKENKDNLKQAEAMQPDTIIGPSVSVEGNFKGSGNIIVEGEVKGALKTKGFIKANKNSNIIANITAADAEIAGQVVGNLTIKNNLQITENAIVQGDIETATISIAYGAIVNGNLKMKINDKTEIEDKINLTNKNNVK